MIKLEKHFTFGIMNLLSVEINSKYIKPSKRVFFLTDPRCSIYCTFHCLPLKKIGRYPINYTANCTGWYSCFFLLICLFSCLLKISAIQLYRLLYRLLYRQLIEQKKLYPTKLADGFASNQYLSHICKIPAIHP